MTRVGEQSRHRVRCRCFVITADFAMSIHQNHPGAMHGNSGFIAAIGHRKFEIIMRKFVNRGLGSCEKIPAFWVGAQLLRVPAQNLRLVFFRVDTKRDQMHVGLFQWLLQFTHPCADHRTRPWTSRVNEVSDPNLPSQSRGVEWLSLLVYELEMWHRAVGGNAALTERVHLDLSQPKQKAKRHQRNEDQGDLPGDRPSRRCAIYCCRSCVHAFVRTKAASNSGR